MATKELTFEIEELKLKDVVAIQMHRGRINPNDIEIEVQVNVLKVGGEIFKRLRVTKIVPAAHLTPVKNAVLAILDLVNQEDLGFPP